MELWIYISRYWEFGVHGGQKYLQIAVHPAHFPPDPCPHYPMLLQKKVLVLVLTESCQLPLHLLSILMVLYSLGISYIINFRLKIIFKNARSLKVLSIFIGDNTKNPMLKYIFLTTDLFLYTRNLYFERLKPVFEYKITFLNLCSRVWIHKVFCSQKGGLKCPYERFLVNKIFKKIPLVPHGISNIKGCSKN